MVQVIFEFDGTPEDYVAQSAQREVPAPRSCHQCGASARMESLGYYSRGLSSSVAALVILIVIHRFRCRRCGRTVSFLPIFAQPYRLVRNETVQKFLEGTFEEVDVIRWIHLLRRYARRFSFWFPQLLAVTGKCIGPDPPPNTVQLKWRFFDSVWGDLPSATFFLVKSFRITAFGRYRCHQSAEN
jgi:hypothetical protein